MNENIYSATSNFDMKYSSIFSQLSQNEEMFGGDDNTISEFNLDNLFEDENIIQNEFSATSTFHEQNGGNFNDELLFNTISEFKLSEIGQYSETSTNAFDHDASEFSTTSI